MLSELTIKNYALIDTLQVQFDSGFTSITGETGAGKSILLGGLALVLGKRADLSNINDPTQKCIIEATFNIENFNLQPFFEEQGVQVPFTPLFEIVGKGSKAAPLQISLMAAKVGSVF